MDRLKIEKVTASLAIIFLTLTTFGVILFTADQFFSWDLFSPQVQTAIGFILLSSALVIFSSVVVNIMLNISIIAEVAQKMLRKDK